MNQRGSAVIIALGVMLVTSLMLAAILPLVTSELHMSVGNKDGVAAQYVAEAGAKRAVTMFYRSEQDWSWLDQSEDTPTWHMLNDNENERYHVKIALSQDGELIQPDSPASANVYYVISTGKVNDATKKVSAKVTVESMQSGGGGVDGLDTSNSNSPAYYTVYAEGALMFHGNVAINGRPAASGDYINKTGDMFLPYKSLTLPTYNTLLSNINKNGTDVNFDHDSSIYNSKKNTYTISSNANDKTYIFLTNDMVVIDKNTNLSNVTIITEGPLEIEQNVNLNNCKVFTNVEMRIKDSNGHGASGGQNLNGCLIVSAGSMTASGGPGFSNSVVFCYGAFTANGGTNLNQGMILVAGPAVFNGNSNLNYGGNIDAFFSGGESDEKNITVSTWESI